MKPIKLTILFSLIALGVFFGVSVNAAISFDAATTRDVNATSSTVFTHTVGSTSSNPFLSVGVMSKDSTAGDTVVSSVSSSVNGAFTQAADSGFANTVRAGMWYLAAPSTGLHSITVTWAGVNDQTMSCAISLYGVDQNSPLNATSSVTGTKQAAQNPYTATTTVTTVTDGAWAIDAHYNQATNAASITIAFSGTQLCNGGSGDSHKAGTWGPVSPAGSQNTGWTVSTNTIESWATGVIAVKPFVSVSAFMSGLRVWLIWLFD